MVDVAQKSESVCTIQMGDMTRLFGVAKYTVRRWMDDGLLRGFQKEGGVHWQFNVLEVVRSILDGSVRCNFMGKDISDEESLAWAYDAFNKTMLHAQPCPSGAALRYWLDAAETRAGSERLMVWKFRKITARSRKVKVENVGDSASVVDPPAVIDDVSCVGADDGNGREPAEEEVDEDAARIEDQIKRAIDSKKIDAPYRGQDPEANRKEREAPIYIPNLEEV